MDTIYNLNFNCMILLSLNDSRDFMCTFDIACSGNVRDLSIYICKLCFSDEIIPLIVLQLIISKRNVI